MGNSKDVFSYFSPVTIAKSKQLLLPLFNNAPDPVDFTEKDYYDELQYPDVKNEGHLYIRGSRGGLVTVK